MQASNMGAEQGNIPAPLGTATRVAPAAPAAAPTAAETAQQRQDATMATMGARTETLVPAKRLPKRRSDDHSLVRADDTPSIMTLEEFHGVVLKLRSDEAIESKWCSKWRWDVEVAVTNHDDLLDL